MRILIGKPNLPDDFKKKIARAVGKELTIDIKDIDKHLFISVYSQNRTVARFTFEIRDKTAELDRSFIIEHDYNSFEFCISEVIKYLQKKKIKYLIW